MSKRKNWLLLTMMLLLNGCGTRYLLPQEGTVGILATDTKAEVFWPDKDGKLVKSKGKLKAGMAVKIPEAEKKP